MIDGFTVLCLLQLSECLSSAATVCQKQYPTYNYSLDQVLVDHHDNYVTISCVNKEWVLENIRKIKIDKSKRYDTDHYHFVLDKDGIKKGGR